MEHNLSPLAGQIALPGLMALAVLIYGVLHGLMIAWVWRNRNDERHICPLQLEVIERGIDLWTNPGDVVLTPFMGIGSEAYVALKSGRRAIGVELKASYYNAAVKNLKMAVAERSQVTLFDLAEVQP